MTREQIEKVIERIVPNGYLDFWCKDYFAVGVRGGKTNFIVNMTPVNRAGSNYGLQFSDRKIGRNLKARWKLCRHFYEEA